MSKRLLVNLAWPGVGRDLAYDEWIDAFKEVANFLNWDECPKCEGLERYCTRCYGIGKVDPNE